MDELHNAELQNPGRSIPFDEWRGMRGLSHDEAMDLIRDGYLISYTIGPRRFVTESADQQFVEQMEIESEIDEAEARQPARTSSVMDLMTLDEWCEYHREDPESARKLIDDGLLTIRKISGREVVDDKAFIEFFYEGDVEFVYGESV